MDTGIMIPLFNEKSFFMKIRDFVQIALSAYRYGCQERIFDSTSRISSLWVASFNKGPKKLRARPRQMEIISLRASQLQVVVGQIGISHSQVQ